jgi:hypothetical protein
LGAGRFDKGSSIGVQKTIARLAFGESQSNANTNWQFALRAIAPFEAVTTDWFRWASGVTDVAIGDYCYGPTSERWYRATTAGTTGATAPTHTSGAVSDGNVTWQYVYYGNDSGVLIVDDLGRISTNGTRGTNSYRFKQSPYATDSSHKFVIEATAEANGTDDDKAVALYFMPTDASGAYARYISG